MENSVVTEIEFRRLRVNISYSITRCEDAEQRRELEEFLNKELRKTLHRLSELHVEILARKNPIRMPLQITRGPLPSRAPRSIAN